ncbi:flagellar biosynthetic protein FliR [Zestomonas carbonaria]|uniref:Flagellar biosynthetic protein FliR n=1 Tax=Zestomonas carbonaria TaxID=2762745 RepID=A0A7U7ICA8_9GAMM|nr:flagellar biosynthetic protein FliR [Pseudomonas carbonaria]CAD5110202.1 Flagellar biosynthetic protein FliR [Pseudomonas carbonaria]
MPANEPLFQATQYLHALQSYWWPFCRIMALFGLAPLFSHRALSVRIRVLLALALTLVLARALPDPPAIEPLSLGALFATLEQIAVGLLLGLALQLVFVVFSLVGEVVSTQMGMSMARYNDPMNGVSSSSILSLLYFLLLALLFLSIDGHLLTVSVLYQSFVHWPVGSGLHYQGFATLAHALGWVFAAAVLITLPVVFCMTLVQFCFGLLNRISPAMNLFSLGFPMAILTGLLCVYLTLPDLPANYLRLTRDLLDNLGTLMRSGADV